MNNWYDAYIGFPYQHLGNDPQTGIDCFNLCKLVFEKELNIFLPYSTHDFCNIVDENWYQKTHERLFDNFKDKSLGWEKVYIPRKYDIILMSLGSTHITNHCALYVDSGKILQTMIDRKSWVAPYGRYYEQYTTGIFRWKDLNN